MRPLLLELHGFGPFREVTTIDFRDHDLIAFTGPTGAGKSTIIDGLAFALYGSVARYENEKLVAPIINAVSTEARVRLDFSVGDTPYTAVRVVRRSGSGASTKEARLESGDEVLASTAHDVTAAVGQIVGLSFSQFTKTVVLPQGDFAQFLKVKPSVRQRLLRHMLGLDLYTNVGKAARLRARDLKAKSEAFERTLTDERTNMTDAKLAKLQKRVEELDSEMEKIEEAAELRQSALEQLEATTSVVDDLGVQIEALDLLAVPTEARTTATRIEKAVTALDSAQTKLDAARDTHDVLVEARADLPPSDELDDLHNRHGVLLKLSNQLEELSIAQEKSTVTLAKATTAAEKAQTQLADAESAVDHARILAGAGGIAATLHVGDNCPVCSQLIESLPKTAASDKQAAVLAKAEAARQGARASAQKVVESLQTATAANADAIARYQAAEDRVLELRAELADQPTLKQTMALQKKAAAADGKVDAAYGRLVAATEAFEAATAAVEESTSSEAELRRDFTTARDTVSSLHPPAPSQEAIHEDWSALVAWGKEVRKELRVNLREQKKDVTAQKKIVEQAEKVLVRVGSTHFPPNAVPNADRAAAMVRNSHADARVALANAEDRVERQRIIKEQIGDVERERVQADELGKHLASGMFERWIMSDVMTDLSERASLRLLDLSGGAFSLMTDGRDFQIRDHRNADEVRSARTLSGGETFLTSLSLALALSDSITDLASTATPPLESMFLDEGFGTLDAETLDTVASAIEDLGASGRLIGIVTHLPDLAERIPTRIEVRPTPTGSVVVTP